MNAKLKPCPFCGGDDVVCCDQGDDDFAVTCKSCGSSSPFDDVEDIAISAWNTRAALAQPQNDAEAAAWRYRYELKEDSWGTWTVQKNKPNWFEPTMTDVQVEPLFTAPPSPELERMRKALAWCVSEIELASARSRTAFPADAEKKKLFDEAKALSRAGDNHVSEREDR